MYHSQWKLQVTRTKPIYLASTLCPKSEDIIDNPHQWWQNCLSLSSHQKLAYFSLPDPSEGWQSFKGPQAGTGQSHLWFSPRNPCLLQAQENRREKSRNNSNEAVVEFQKQQRMVLGKKVVVLGNVAQSRNMRQLHTEIEVNWGHLAGWE